jgi:RHS repeat-associated protein
VATSGSTTTTTTYYAAGPVTAINVNGTLSYLVSDTLGSTTVALSASGGVAADQLFTPYGATRYASGTMPTSYGFTGQRLDPSGLQYFNARYYDSSVGQFTSADTEQGPNRYAYVSGNPETLTDPTGQFGRCGGSMADGVCRAQHPRLTSPKPTPKPKPSGHGGSGGSGQAYIETTRACLQTRSYLAARQVWRSKMRSTDACDPPPSKLIDGCFEPLQTHPSSGNLNKIESATVAVINRVTSGRIAGYFDNAGPGCGGADHSSCGTEVVFCLVTSPCNQEEDYLYGNRYLAHAQEGNDCTNQLCQESDALNDAATQFNWFGGIIAVPGAILTLISLLAVPATEGASIPWAILGAAITLVGASFLALGGIYGICVNVNELSAR